MEFVGGVEPALGEDAVRKVRSSRTKAVHVGSADSVPNANAVAYALGPQVVRMIPMLPGTFGA